MVGKQTKARRDAPVRRERFTLSERDRRAFFAALINPPKPSERLARALAEHKRRIFQQKQE